MRFPRVEADELVADIAPPPGARRYGRTKNVAKRTTRGFAIALIPHTIAHSNLGTLKKGDVVNVEVDLIARYLDVLKKRR